MVQKNGRLKKNDRKKWMIKKMIQKNGLLQKKKIRKNGLWYPQNITNTTYPLFLYF